jgi:hypothetical protein
MPLNISVADFKMTFAVCELRYENAYLIFDRTGQVCQDARDFFTDCNVVSAAPNQTIFQAKEGSFFLELAQCRFSTTKPDTSLEKFAEHCKKFFDSVTGNLEIKVFTRVGLRALLRKDFETLDEAKAALTSLKLVCLQPADRYGVASEPREIILRWESDQSGVMLRLKAESGKIDFVLPPELEAEKAEIHKSFNGLVLDVDYYTVAPVERTQWDAAAWIQRSIRTIKRDTDAIFGN